MSDIKLSEDNKFQNIFNPDKKTNKSLEKRIESSYLKGKGITTILDNMPTSSTPVAVKSTASKISTVTVGGYDLTKVEDTSLSFKRKITHRLNMFFNRGGYKDDFKAKVVALADAYRKQLPTLSYEDIPEDSLSETDDKHKAIEDVRKNMGALRNYPEFHNDREVVLAAVTKNGPDLQYASPELKNDREIVLAAVKQYPFALFHASPDLQDDPEIRKAAGYK